MYLAHIYIYIYIIFTYTDIRIHVARSRAALFLFIQLLDFYLKYGYGGSRKSNKTFNSLGLFK
jgi:hypothetical protein